MRRVEENEVARREKSNKIIVNLWNFVFWVEDTKFFRRRVEENEVARRGKSNKIIVNLWTFVFLVGDAKSFFSTKSRRERRCTKREIQQNYGHPLKLRFLIGRHKKFFLAKSRRERCCTKREVEQNYPQPLKLHFLSGRHKSFFSAKNAPDAGCPLQIRYIPPTYQRRHSVKVAEKQATMHHLLLFVLLLRTKKVMKLVSFYLWNNKIFYLLFYLEFKFAFILFTWFNSFSSTLWQPLSCYLQKQL
jgi:hypothetical protein